MLRISLVKNLRRINPTLLSSSRLRRYSTQSNEHNKDKNDGSGVRDLTARLTKLLIKQSAPTPISQVVVLPPPSHTFEELYFENRPEIDITNSKDYKEASSLLSKLLLPQELGFDWTVHPEFDAQAHKKWNDFNNQKTVIRMISARALQMWERDHPKEEEEQRDDDEDESDVDAGEILSEVDEEWRKLRKEYKVEREQMIQDEKEGVKRVEYSVSGEELIQPTEQQKAEGEKKVEEERLKQGITESMLDVAFARLMAKDQGVPIPSLSKIEKEVLTTPIGDMQNEEHRQEQQKYENFVKQSDEAVKVGIYNDLEEEFPPEYSKPKVDGEMKDIQKIRPPRRPPIFHTLTINWNKSTITFEYTHPKHHVYDFMKANLVTERFTLPVDKPIITHLKNLLWPTSYVVPLYVAPEDVNDLRLKKALKETKELMRFLNLQKNPLGDPEADARRFRESTVPMVITPSPENLPDVIDPRYPHITKDKIFDEFGNINVDVLFGTGDKIQYTYEEERDRERERKAKEQEQREQQEQQEQQQVAKQ
eukprot:TRINITY_DN7254_c0_g1_i1.p1 TRINITY_DN7254_c0_g1~~TRINITY_DN7254_c0_g1_i1.p1  ORF type:complete len:536 (-),score=135.55 TRINITY_DN7254_c0_g1_i1:164-1771(-)